MLARPVVPGQAAAGSVLVQQELGDTLKLLGGYGGAITSIRRRPNDIQQTRYT